MNDSELLRRAAKAASIQLEGDSYWHDGAAQWVRWDPLADNGDAFCLALKLNITVRRGASSGAMVATRDRWMYVEPIGGDECSAAQRSAARRAVVRAAAMDAHADEGNTNAWPES